MHINTYGFYKDLKKTAARCNAFIAFAARALFRNCRCEGWSFLDKLQLRPFHVLRPNKTGINHNFLHYVRVQNTKLTSNVETKPASRVTRSGKCGGQTAPISLFVGGYYWTHAVLYRKILTVLSAQRYKIYSLSSYISENSFFLLLLSKSMKQSRCKFFVKLTWMDCFQRNLRHI